MSGAHAVGVRGGNRRDRLEPSRLGSTDRKSAARSKPLPERSRLHTIADAGLPWTTKMLYAVVDVLDEIAAETGKTAPQIALNWLLDRPTVSSVIIALRPRGRAGIPRLWCESSRRSDA